MIDLAPQTLLHAAATMDSLGLLPMPKGVNEQSLSAAGGMKPLLRLAFGRAAAEELSALGMGGWWLGSLCGHNMKPGDIKNPPLDLGDDEACMNIVHYLCEINQYSTAMSTHGTLWRAVQGRRGAERAQPVLDALEAMDYGEPLLTRRADLLRLLAASMGIDDPYSHPPMDVGGLWTVEEVDGQVVATAPLDDVPSRTGDRVTVRTNSGYLIEFDREHMFLDTRPAVDCLDYMFVGRRVRLTYHGATPEHPGYLVRARDLDDIEETERRRAYLRTMARLAEPYTCNYSDGSPAKPGHNVRITSGCLEVAGGTEGRITSLCREMVMVKFEGRRLRVPCFPEALEHIDEEPMAIAA